MLLSCPCYVERDAFSLCLEFLQGQVSSYQAVIRGPGTNVVGLDQQSPLQSVLHSFDFSRFYRAIKYNDYLMTYDIEMIMEKNSPFITHIPHCVMKKGPCSSLQRTGKRGKCHCSRFWPSIHQDNVSRDKESQPPTTECSEGKYCFEHPHFISPLVSFINCHKQNSFTNK